MYPDNINKDEPSAQTTPTPMATPGLNWPTMIVEGFEAALFSLDQNWRFTYLNSHAATFWGRLGKESLVGKVLWEEFPTLVGTTFEKFYRQVMQEGQPGQLEEFSPTTQSWYEVRVYPLAEGLIVYFQDITTRKQLEQSLKESEERYRALSEATFEGLALQENGLILEANQQMVDMFGYTHQELVGKPISQIIAPESRPAFQEDIANNSTRIALRTALRKDDSLFYTESRRRPVQYQGRTVWIVAIRDVTESKLKEDQLRQSEYRFRVLSEATLEGIIIHRNGTILEANESVAPMLGFNSSQELIGRFLFDMVAPQNRDAIQKQAAEGSEELQELVSLKQDGSPFPMEVRGKNIEYQGQPARQVVLRDITERKLKEQALKDSQERYKFLSNATTEGIIVFREGIIIEANQSAARIYGYDSSQEMIGQVIPKMVAPQSLAEVQQKIAENYDKPFEIMAAKKDSTYFPAEVWGETVNYRGQPVRLVTSRDITERKQQEQALKESEERYRMLSDASYEGLCIFSDGHIVEANRRMAEIFGYSLEEFIGLSAEKIVTPEALASTQQRIANSITASIENTGLRKDGTIFPYEARGRMIEYRGRPARLMAVRDLTEIKQAQQELKESEERYKILSEAAYEGLILHRQGIIQEANQRGAEMFGYTRQELIGLHILQLAVPEERLALQNRLANHYNASGSEFVGLRKDGTRFFIETRGKVIDYQGHSIRLSAFRDVTELKLAERQLRESEARLSGIITSAMDAIGIVTLTF
jgi:PAS domain S-box-containing protein